MAVETVVESRFDKVAVVVDINVPEPAQRSTANGRGYLLTAADPEDLPKLIADAGLTETPREFLIAVHPGNEDHMIALSKTVDCVFEHAPQFFEARLQELWCCSGASWNDDYRLHRDFYERIRTKFNRLVPTYRYAVPQGKKREDDYRVPGSVVLASQWLNLPNAKAIAEFSTWHEQIATTAIATRWRDQLVKLPDRVKMLLRGITWNSEHEGEIPKIVFVDDEKVVTGTEVSKKAVLGALLEELLGSAIKWHRRIEAPENMANLLRDENSHQELMEDDLKALLWIVDFVLLPHVDTTQHKEQTVLPLLDRLNKQSANMHWVYITSLTWRRLQTATTVGVAGGLRRNISYHVGPPVFSLSGQPRAKEFERYKQQLDKEIAARNVSLDPKSLPDFPLLEFIVRRLEYYPALLWALAEDVLDDLLCLASGPAHGDVHLVSANRCRRIASLPTTLLDTECKNCSVFNLGGIAMFNHHYRRLMERPVFWGAVLENWWTEQRAASEHAVLKRLTLTEVRSLMEHLSVVVAALPRGTEELPALAKYYVQVIDRMLTDHNVGARLCPRTFARAIGQEMTHGTA